MEHFATGLSNCIETAHLHCTRRQPVWNGKSTCQPQTLGKKRETPPLNWLSSLRMFFYRLQAMNIKLHLKNVIRKASIANPNSHSVVKCLSFVRLIPDVQIYCWMLNCFSNCPSLRNISTFIPSSIAHLFLNVHQFGFQFLRQKIFNKWMFNKYSRVWFCNVENNKNYSAIGILISLIFFYVFSMLIWYSNNFFVMPFRFYISVFCCSFSI